MTKVEAPPSPAQDTDLTTEDADRSFTSVSVAIREQRRRQQLIESSAKAIQNRIRYLKQEDEKVWKDMEDMRRAAAKRDDAQLRVAERTLAEHAVAVFKQRVLEDNREQVKRRTAEELAGTERRQGLEGLRLRQALADEVRVNSADAVRRKRLEKAQLILSNSERVISMQREQAEASYRGSQARARRLEEVALQRELERQEEHERTERLREQARLPQLEAEEMAWYTRLQNSKATMQSVINTLEETYGYRSPMTMVLKSRSSQSLSLRESEY